MLKCWLLLQAVIISFGKQNSKLNDFQCLKSTINSIHFKPHDPGPKRDRPGESWCQRPIPNHQRPYASRVVILRNKQFLNDTQWSNDCPWSFQFLIASIIHTPQVKSVYSQHVQGWFQLMQRYGFEFWTKGSRSWYSKPSDCPAPVWFRNFGYLDIIDVYQNTLNYLYV